MKKSIKILITALTAVVFTVTSIFLVPVLMTKAQEIDDSNPELTLVTIQSNAENIVDSQPLYTAESNYSEGNGKYHLETNAYVPWMSEDEVAFAYKKYNVKDTGDDWLDASVTIEHSPSSPPGQAVHSKASVGIMVRSGIENNAAFVFLHVRGNTVLVVYRTNEGGNVTVQYSNTAITYPLQVKLNKKGNSVQLYYKAASAENWNRFQYAVGMRATGPLYVGLGANSSSQENWVVGDYSNLLIQGLGTWVEGDEDETESEKPPAEIVDEDPPMLSDVLLRETFTDGDFFNTPAKKENPVWGNGPLNHEIININQNRWWFKNFNDSQDYIGAQTWTDYSVSLDIMFSDDCDPNPVAASNTVRLHARLTDIPFYGLCDYYVKIYEGYKIAIGKRSFENLSPEKDGVILASVSLRDLDAFPSDYTCLGDDLSHRLRFEVFDNKFTAYWDGTEVLTVKDTAENGTTPIGESVFGAGCVGISTLQTSVYLDNLIVRELKDDFGGDYDKQIGGNWNDPIPDYVSSWAY